MSKSKRRDRFIAEKTPPLDAAPSVEARGKSLTLAKGSNARAPSSQFDDFYERGEAAWAEFLRTGVTYSVDEVFDRLQARIDAKRREIAARCS